MNNKDFERERKMLAEEMYLNFFNNYLFQNGVISDGEILWSDWLCHSD